MKFDLNFGKMKDELYFFYNDIMLCFYPKEDSHLLNLWRNICDVELRHNNRTTIHFSIFPYQQNPCEKKLYSYNEIKNDLRNIDNTFLIFDINDVNITEEELFYFKLKYC